MQGQRREEGNRYTIKLSKAWPLGKGGRRLQQETLRLPHHLETEVAPSDREGSAQGKTLGPLL